MKLLKIVNTHQLIPYTTRPGDGSPMYSYLNCIDVCKKAVILTTVFPEDNNKQIIMQINDPVCIEQLPLLLSWKISSYQALQNVEKHLYEKLKIQEKSEDLRDRIYDLSFTYFDKDDFIKLCTILPRPPQEKWLIPQTPFKIADNEIITYLESLTTSTLKNRVVNYIRNNITLFSNKLNKDSIPEDLLQNFQNNK